MKLNNIAYAVSISLAALALTACGNSGKKSSTPQTKPQTQQPAPNTNADAQKEAEKQKIAAIAKFAEKEGNLSPEKAREFAEKYKGLALGSDELKKALEKAVKEQNAAAAGSNTANSPISNVIVATNPTIDGFDTKNVPSVSTKHYVRHTDSTFDRYSNPSNLASSGDSTSKTITNPYLSNFVIASEADSNNKVYAIDSMGEEVVPKPKAGNKHHGEKVEAKVTDYFQSEYTVKIGNGSHEPRHYVREGLKIGSGATAVTIDSKSPYAIRTIQEENGRGLITDYGNDIKVKADGKNSFLTWYNTGRLATDIDVHGKSGLVVYNKGKLAYGAEENVYYIGHDGLTYVEDRLHVAANKTKDGQDVANNLSTRVFGKNYRDYEAGLTGKQLQNNSYVATINAQGVLDGTIRTVPLQHVQYGRLTANIDALTEDPTPNNKNDETLIYRQFAQHGSRGTVDTYFYRGTHSTTIEQMNAVKAKGGKLQYHGHAITYNLGPSVSAKDGGLPTSYSNKSNTIGNFVQATFDTKTNKVTGSIYNLVNNTADLSKPNHFKQQDLVKFEGVVSGNTVADGVSTKLGATPEKGSFVASFYGKEAQEMGGNVSSVEKAKGFSDAKWGAVFGATVGDTPRNFSTGQH